MDSTAVGKPVSQVADDLAIRLEDYEWALKKHGIETVVGSLTSILDAKYLAGVSAAAGLMLAGGEFWAAVGLSAIIACRVALSLTGAYVDLKDTARGPRG